MLTQQKEICQIGLKQSQAVWDVTSCMQVYFFTKLFGLSYFNLKKRTYNDKFLIIDQTYQSLSSFTLHHSRNQILEAFFYKLTRILSVLHPLTYTSPFCVRYARCSMNGINKLVLQLYMQHFTGAVVYTQTATLFYSVYYRPSVGAVCLCCMRKGIVKTCQWAQL